MRCLLTTGVLASAVLLAKGIPLEARQDVVGWTTVTSSSVAPPVSVIGWKTIPSSDAVQVVTTTQETTEWVVQTTMPATPIVSIFPVTSWSGTSIVGVKAATVTIYPATTTPSESADSEASNSGQSSRAHDGAIAGGVIGGAIALAVVLALLFMRFRNKKSQVHWRNRNLGHWQERYFGDVKAPVAPEAGVTEASNPAPPSFSPMAPTFVREKRHPSATFQSEDGERDLRNHHRRQSFASIPGSSSARREQSENHEMVARSDA